MRFSSTALRFAETLGIAALAALLWASSAWATPTFSKLSAEMNERRYEPGVATLSNGKVLVAGGYNETGHDLKSAEMFNPETQAFESLTAEMNVNRAEMAYVALPNGKVLIAGGYNGTNNLKSAELFNPTTNTFEMLPAEMTAERAGRPLRCSTAGRC